MTVSTLAAAIGELVLSIVGSLIAAILVVIFGGFFSRKLRWLITLAFGRWLGVDIEFVYQNVRDAAGDIAREVVTSHKIDILTGRGNDLNQDMFAPVLRGDLNHTARIRILFPALRVEQGEDDWTEQRNTELSGFDQTFRAGMLKNQIRVNIDYALGYSSMGRVETRSYNAPNIGRIIIFDRYVFFTPYSSDQHGHTCEVLKISRGGTLAGALERLFCQLWERDRKFDSSLSPKAPESEL